VNLIKGVVAALSEPVFNWHATQRVKGVLKYNKRHSTKCESVESGVQNRSWQRCITTRKWTENQVNPDGDWWSVRC
jgi:hypothetical protein